MTKKTPSLVLMVLAAAFAIPMTPARAAAKSSKGPAKSASSTKKAETLPAKPTPKPEAPKALAVSPEEIKKATATKSPATVTEKDKVTAADKKEEPSTDKEGGPPASKEKEKKPAIVSTMTVDEIAGFESYPPALQEVVRNALDLTTQKLRYQFGASDPKEGGMDCSGTVSHVLRNSGVKDVPRQSDEMCRWVMRRAVLYRTENTVSLKASAFAALHPGDLLFWTGTYDVGGQREIPISHVMMYLGKRKKDGKPIIFGASDGRTFEGERRNGVSVFDFFLPQRGGKAAFYGYGPIPGLPKEEVRRAIVRAVPAYAKQ